MGRGFFFLLVIALTVFIGCSGGGSSNNPSNTPAETVADPTFSPQGGTYGSAQSVTLATATSGAGIRYTVDGSTPSPTSGTLYSGAITVSSTETVKAIACKDGMNPSGVTSAAYTIMQTVADPTFSPQGGTYTSAQSVTLETTTSGASIRYTTDGSIPSSTTGTLYAGAFTVSSTTTVKAIAYKSGMNSSGVTSATYALVYLADSSWPEFKGNNRRTGLSSVDTSANNGAFSWNYATGDMIFSSPAIGADGTIYVGSLDGELYAINADGTFKWSYTAVWMDSAPAIGADGTIYVGTLDGELLAINADGTFKWSYTTENAIESSPAIGADGTIYIGSEDSKLYAVNADGTFKWSYTTGDYVESSPAIGADGTIYVGSDDDNLYAINADGTFKWSYATGDDVFSSPAVGADGTIYFGSLDRNFYAIGP